MKLCFSQQNKSRWCEYKPISFPSIGDPHLLSIHNVLISHLHCLRLKASNIRTCTRLSDTISLRKENTRLLFWYKINWETGHSTVTYTHEWLLCHPSQVFWLLGLITCQYDGHLLWKKCNIHTFNCTVNCNELCCHQWHRGAQVNKDLLPESWPRWQFALLCSHKPAPLWWDSCQK